MTPTKKALEKAEEILDQAKTQDDLLESISSALDEARREERAECAKEAESYPENLKGMDVTSDCPAGGIHDWCYDCNRVIHKGIGAAIRARQREG